MNLEVIIPHLLLPAPLSTLVSKPSAPALTKLLSRANRSVFTREPAFSALAERFGLTLPYPVAPIFARMDGLSANDGAWMFAEPINLSPERDWLKLAPARLLDLTVDESKQLVELLNQYFCEQGLRFYYGKADRWYVHCPAEEIPIATPAYAASLGPLIECQPQSKGAINWRSLQNETQMLFHNHSVNQRRDAEGRPTINGVWVWGGGTAPTLRKPAINYLMSDIPLALELAQQAGIETRPMSWTEAEDLQGNLLIASDELSNLTRDYDLPGWTAAIERIDQSLFEPISTALARGTISQLTIRANYGGYEQVFAMTKRDLMLRFWRTSKPLSSYA